MKSHYIDTIREDEKLSEEGKTMAIQKVCKFNSWFHSVSFLMDFFRQVNDMKILIGYPEWISNQTHLEQIHYSVRGIVNV